MQQDRIDRIVGEVLSSEFDFRSAASNEHRLSGATEKASTPGRIALGADHGGWRMKEIIARHLRETGRRVHDFGTHGEAPVDYPDFALKVARAVASGRCDAGIMIDGAGIGSCMAANKVRGIRAAMCYDRATARNSREHNNANLLTLGGKMLEPDAVVEIVETWLSTPFAGGRHWPRVNKIMKAERNGRPD